MPVFVKILQAEELFSLSEAADLLCEMDPSHFVRSGFYGYLSPEL